MSSISNELRELGIQSAVSLFNHTLIKTSKKHYTRAVKYFKSKGATSIIKSNWFSNDFKELKFTSIIKTLFENGVEQVQNKTDNY